MKTKKNSYYLKNIKRLYKGKIDLRDYEVEKAIKNNKGYKITCDEYPEEEMLLSVEDLKKGIKSEEFIISKIGGKNYYLYSYFWRTK